MARRFLDRRFRPRLLRAFQDWYGRNQQRLAFPIRLVENRRRMMRFRIDGMHESITLILGGISLSVCVDWRGSCWDTLLSLDAVPKRVRGSEERSYRCTICSAEGKDTVFPSRTALWEDHLFEPFADWLNGTLAPATHLRIGGSQDTGMTWAGLVMSGRAKKDNCVVELPLR